MSDMRQKLLPVFLEEAGRKILQLDSFLSAVGGDGKTLEDLAGAFRAAHTLKGTAALVKADAVCALSGRIEGLLEGHYEQERFPADIEYEAMQLASERLKLLISAVEKGQEEPAGLLAEAELALKLATAMPGRRSLDELLNQPGPVDPFSDDPDLDEGDAQHNFTEPNSLMDDPFADDPSFDAKPEINKKSPADPFAADPALETIKDSSVDVAASAPVMADPFADDPAIEPNVIEPPLVSKDASGAVPVFDDPFADDPELDSDVSSEAIAETPKEESYAERMRKRLAKESAVGTAERLAATLSRQDDQDIVERKFTCCCFRVADKDYYLPISNMIEVSDLPSIIRLPLAPSVVRGLINLRGKVLPVIDLSVQAGGSSQFVAVRKLVVAEANGEQLAFLTDGIPDLSVEISGEKVDVNSFIEQFRAGAT